MDGCTCLARAALRHGRFLLPQYVRTSPCTVPYYEIQTLILFGNPQAQLDNFPLVVVIINFGCPK